MCKKLMILTGVVWGILAITGGCYATVIDGYCFLQNQVNHEGTKVLFEVDPWSPGGQTDSTYTNEYGYYRIDLVPGEYTVTYTHEEYYYWQWFVLVEYWQETMPWVTLYQTTQNVISGELSGTLEAGNYLLTGNISVASGQSLIVEPGVVFLLSSSYQFDINGYLEAVGTEQDSILFAFIYAAYSWYGINFNNSASDLSQLGYCRISSSNESGISCVQSSPTITHCTLIDNSSGWGSGGGIYCEGSDAVISDCYLSGNSGGWENGGGIYCLSSNPSISNCVITDNGGGWGNGGGIYCEDSHPTISYCTLSGNTGGWGNGGGIYCFTSSPTLSHCTILDNTGGWGNGGGMYCELGSPIITNCTVTGNEGSWEISGGLHFLGSAPTIVNTVVAYNSGSGGIYFSSSPDASVSYCDFYSNEGGNFTGSPPPGLGVITGVNANGDPCDDFFNIFLDPDFISTTLNDYRLQWGSPCIDAGDPDPIYNDPDGTVADIGAFYFDQSAPVRILLIPQGMPIAIPPVGGSFDYTIQATNIEATSQWVTAWCDVTLPDGSVVGPVMGPASTTIDPGLTIGRDRTQYVPAGAPAGVYSYNAFAVAGLDTSTDSFPFLKIGSCGMDWASGWFNTGESFGDAGESQIALSALPGTYSLAQNYPNPFNPLTTIRFELPEAGIVNLFVHDIAGRLVVEILDGWRNAGFHEVTFDATDLASGIYFCRIEVQSYEEVLKMVLIK